MSKQFYQHHLEQTIRQNQLLKRSLRHNHCAQSSVTLVLQLLQSIFPEIPPFEVTDSAPSSELIQVMMSYYKETTSAWKQKQMKKIELLIEQHHEETTTLVTNLNHQIYRYMQLLSDSGLIKDIVSEQDFLSRYFIQQNINKYLKQVTSSITHYKLQNQCLRSQIFQRQNQSQMHQKQIKILKQQIRNLQFSTLQSTIKSDKYHQLHIKQKSHLLFRIDHLNQQLLIWKRECDSYAHQNNRLKGQSRIKFRRSNSSQKNQFEEQQRLLQNLSEKRTQELKVEETNNTNIWVIRGDNFERSYVINESQDISNDFSISKIDKIDYFTKQNE